MIIGNWLLMIYHMVPKNILIIGHSNIGDVCYDTVVIAPLRRNFPQARISFLSSSRAQDILEGYTGIDKIILFDTHTKDRGIFGHLKLINFLRQERFDLIIVLNSSLLYKFLGVSSVWRARKTKKHAAQGYLELLRLKGLAVGEAVFNFGLKKDDHDFAGDFFQKEAIANTDCVMGILPIAAWSLKSWPVENWNELAHRVKQEYGFKTIALGRSSNDSFSRFVLKNLSSEISVAIDKTTLKQALALLNRCNLFIAPDSSLLHLASCMGVQTIGLYGATSAEYFYPYFHKQNSIVSKAPLGCMPCCPGLKALPCKKEFQPAPCMEGITVEDVLEMVKNIIGKK